MSIFVDTSALMSVMAPDDRAHGSATETWRGLASSDETLVTSNYVLVETYSLLQKRYGLECVAAFRNGIALALQVHWVSETQHSAALGAVLAAGRRQLSLVDCVSFVVMRDLGIETAFGLDPHFAEQGFTVLPATDA